MRLDWSPEALAVLMLAGVLRPATAAAPSTLSVPLTEPLVITRTFADGSDVVVAWWDSVRRDSFRLARGC